MTVTWHYQSFPERLGFHVSTQRHHQQQSDAQIHLSTCKVTQSWCFCLYNKKWKRSSRFHHPSPTVKAFVTSQVTHLFAGNARSMCQLATSQERHPFWPGKHHSRICPSSTSTIGDVAELETSWMTFRNGPSTLYNNIYVSIYILRMIYTCKLFKTMMQHRQKKKDFDTYPDQLLCHMYMVDTTTIRDLCFCCTGSGVSRIRSRNACHGARCHPEQSSGWSAPGSTLPSLTRTGHSHIRILQ